MSKLLVMEKLKILIVADVLGEKNNGTTITITRLIDGLEKLGWEVLVVSPQAVDKKNYYVLKKRNFFVFNNYVQKNGVVLAVPDKILLTNLIKKVDIVHIALPFKTGKMALKICKKLGVPVTAGFHCPAEAFTAHIGLKNFKLLNYLIYRRYYNQFYKKIDVVHCPTKLLAESLKKKGYKNNFAIISNGVSNNFVSNKKAKPHQLKDKFCILYVGRLSNEKRHKLLVDAVSKSKYNKKIQLIFAGDGPLKQKLIKQSKKLFNQPIIKFMSGEELNNMYNMCDLYVHCSDIETEGISCLEAICCNLVPLISDSARSATKEFALTKDNLFQAGSVISLKNKIEFFIENMQRLNYLKNLYKNYGDNFKIELCIEKMDKMFKDEIKKSV